MFNKGVEIVLPKAQRYFVAVGDLNATNTLWQCNGTNKRGKILESICDQLNLSIINGEEPTSRKSSNIIDLFG